jgi:lysophospholipase L1-like esterase
MYLFGKKMEIKYRVRRMLGIFFTTAVIATQFTATALASSNPSPFGSKWVASWSTAIQSVYIAPTTLQGPSIPAYEPEPDLTFAMPNATVNGASNQTFRMIIKPDLWGDAVRIRFSNVFGTAPVTFNSATIALQDYGANLVKGTSVTLTFGSKKQITVQPGQQVFSDRITLPFVRLGSESLLSGRNLAVSFSVAGNSGPASYHADAFVTSYISPPGSGDATQEEDGTKFPYSTTSVFFISELDVMAPNDTVVVCALGDSITDGTFSTLNGNDRWSNAMSRALHAKFGNRVSVVNAGIAANGVVAPILGEPAVQRVERDVLGLSGVGIVIWMEGINDLGVGVPTDNIIGGYQQVVGTLHAAGVRVIGGTLTSSFVPGGVVPPNSPLAAIDPALAASYGSSDTNSNRMVLNNFILTGGLYDGLVDFAAATTDPDTGTLKAPFVPNSEGSAGDDLHPNRAGYLEMGSAAASAVIDLLSAH